MAQMIKSKEHTSWAASTKSQALVHYEQCLTFISKVRKLRFEEYKLYAQWRRLGKSELELSPCCHCYVSLWVLNRKKIEHSNTKEMHVQFTFFMLKGVMNTSNQYQQTQERKFLPWGLERILIRRQEFQGNQSLWIDPEPGSSLHNLYPDTLHPQTGKDWDTYQILYEHVDTPNSLLTSIPYASTQRHYLTYPTHHSNPKSDKILWLFLLLYPTPNCCPVLSSL